MSLSEVLGICAYTQIKSNMSSFDSFPRKMPRTALLVDGEKKEALYAFLSNTQAQNCYDKRTGRDWISLAVPGDEAK